MICEFCGDELRLEVLEYWPETREFLFDACCETVQNIVLEELPSWPQKQVQEWFELNTGDKIRRIITADTPNWTVDFGLEVVSISQKEAKDFVEQYHRHNKSPRGWRFGAGLMNGPDLVAVVMVGRPVARLLNDGQTVEINRVCVKPTDPPGLTWNACSQLYGWACRQAFGRGYTRVLTYTLESEPGTSLRAAGFIPVARTKGGSWNTPSRPRNDKAPTCRKIRWERYAPNSRNSSRIPLSSIASGVQHSGRTGHSCPPCGQSAEEYAGLC